MSASARAPRSTSAATPTSPAPTRVRRSASWRATPAVAGPFDLGTVVVRSALFINPSTAQVTVKSDPFPSILDGIPTEIRSIQVETTRNQFTLNPTSCEKMQVAGNRRRRKLPGGPVRSLPGRRLHGPAIQTVLHSLHTTKDQQKTAPP